MRSLNKITLATAALLASTAFVNAADIFVPETTVEVVPETVVHHSGGWYLRGDVGFAHNSVSGTTAIIADGAVDPIVYSERSFSSHDLDESWTLGGGIGYQVNDYFRVDATLKHSFDADFNGNSSSGGSYDCAVQTDPAAPDPNLDGDTCHTEDTTTFASTVLLANAYVDLGTFSGFTPYVGAGIGGAYTHWNSLVNDTVCDGVGDCATDDGLANYDTDFDGTHAAKNGWRFAYALHAGASVDIAANLKLDAGYSFTHIEGGDMFGFAGGQGSGTQGHHGEIKTHEVRAGLRYSLN